MLEKGILGATGSDKFLNMSDDHPSSPTTFTSERINNLTLNSKQVKKPEEMVKQWVLKHDGRSIYDVANAFSQAAPYSANAVYEAMRYQTNGGSGLDYYLSSLLLQPPSINDRLSENSHSKKELQKYISLRLIKTHSGPEKPKEEPTMESIEPPKPVSSPAALLNTPLQKPIQQPIGTPERSTSRVIYFNGEPDAKKRRVDGQSEDTSTSSKEAEPNAKPSASSSSTSSDIDSTAEDPLEETFRPIYKLYDEGQHQEAAKELKKIITDNGFTIKAVAMRICGGNYISYTRIFQPSTKKKIYPNDIHAAKKIIRENLFAYNKDKTFILQSTNSNPDNPQKAQSINSNHVYETRQEKKKWYYFKFRIGMRIIVTQENTTNKLEDNELREIVRKEYGCIKKEIKEFDVGRNKQKRVSDFLKKIDDVRKCAIIFKDAVKVLTSDDAQKTQFPFFDDTKEKKLLRNILNGKNGILDEKYKPLVQHLVEEYLQTIGDSDSQFLA